MKKIIVVFIIIISGCSFNDTKKTIVNSTVPFCKLCQSEKYKLKIYNFDFIDNIRDTNIFLSFGTRINLADVVQDKYLYYSTDKSDNVKDLCISFLKNSKILDTIPGSDTRLVLEFYTASSNITLSYVDNDRWLMHDSVLLKLKEDILPKIRKMLKKDNLTLIQ